MQIDEGAALRAPGARNSNRPCVTYGRQTQTLGEHIKNCKGCCSSESRILFLGCEIKESARETKRAESGAKWKAAACKFNCGLSVMK